MNDIKTFHEFISLFFFIQKRDKHVILDNARALWVYLETTLEFLEGFSVVSMESTWSVTRSKKGGCSVITRSCSVYRGTRSLWCLVAEGARHKFFSMMVGLLDDACGSLIYMLCCFTDTR